MVQYYQMTNETPMKFIKYGERAGMVLVKDLKRGSPAKILSPPPEWAEMVPKE